MANKTEYIEVDSIIYKVIYTQDLNTVDIYSITEHDNPHTGEDNPVYDEGEIHGYINDILVNIYNDSLI